MWLKLPIWMLLMVVQVSTYTSYEMQQCRVGSSDNDYIECNLEEECQELMNYANQHKVGETAKKIKEFFEKLKNAPKQIVQRIKYRIAKDLILKTLKDLAGAEKGDDTPLIDALGQFMDLFKPRIGT